MGLAAGPAQSCGAGPRGGPLARACAKGWLAVQLKELMFSMNRLYFFSLASSVFFLLLPRLHPACSSFPRTSSPCQERRLRGHRCLLQSPSPSSFHQQLLRRVPQWRGYSWHRVNAFAISVSLLDLLVSPRLHLVWSRRKRPALRELALVGPPVG